MRCKVVVLDGILQPIMRRCLGLSSRVQRVRPTCRSPPRSDLGPFQVGLQPRLDLSLPISNSLHCASSVGLETLQHIVSAAAPRPSRCPLLVILSPCRAIFIAPTFCPRAAALCLPAGYHASHVFSSPGAPRMQSIASGAVIFLPSSSLRSLLSLLTPRPLVPFVICPLSDTRPSWQTATRLDCLSLTTHPVSWRDRDLEQAAISRALPMIDSLRSLRSH
jgi:hypothetical protein